MKKLILLISFCSVISATKSQEVGLRFGDVLGSNVAIDAVISIGQFNRVHANLSFRHGLGVEAIWDVQVRPLGPEGLAWYIGVGPSLLFDDPFLLGASGEIGIEYRFTNAPIALGLDWRPTLFLIQDVDFSARGFGFNARYVFGDNGK